MNDPSLTWPQARRGEIWTANLGTPAVRHWVAIVSLDARNQSRFIDSILIIPFSSRGATAPSTIQMEAGETGLPGPSWLKGHFISSIRKTQLLQKLPRPLSDRRMREVTLAIRRSFDPDSP